MAAEVEQGVKLTDFLGKEYGPGDTVVYGAMSGRSVNVVLGRVLDIYRVYTDTETFRWKRLGDDAPVPRTTDYLGADTGEVRTAIRVKVQPIRAARWKQHHGRTRYIDTRTGKGIDPDRGKKLPHILKLAHYVYADGTEFPYEAESLKWQQRHANAYGSIGRETFDRHFRKTYKVNYEEPGQPPRFPMHESEASKIQLWYVSRIYQPWVQKVDNGPEPVTLEITDNIVKWEGELPDEVPDEVPGLQD